MQMYTTRPGGCLRTGPEGRAKGRGIICLVSLIWLWPALAGWMPALAAETPTRDSDNVLLTAQDIKALNVHSVQELLNLVPGVKAGSSSVSIRGSYKVRVLLDGLTLNDPGTFSINLDLIPFHNLDRVEVYKGGGGVAFGDDASGGAVVFTTKRLDETSAFVEVAAGSQETLHAKFNLSQRKGGLGLGLSGKYEEDDGYRINGDEEDKRIGAKLSYRPDFWGDGQEPTLSVEFGENRSGLPGYEEYPTPRSRGIDESLGASFTWDNWGIESGTYLTRFGQERMDPDKDTHTMMRTTNLKQQLGRTWELWGFEGVETGLNLETTWAEGSDLDSSQESALGVFISKKFSLDPLPMFLRVGLRANMYSAFENVLNPEAELGLNLGDHRFKLSFSRSNNLPSFRQRYFRYSSLEPNPDLIMEQATNLTLGVSSQWAGFLSSDLSIFNREIDDRITYVRLEEGVGQYQNFGSTRIRGADISLDIKPLDWLNLKPSYTYMEAIDQDTGLWLSCKPRHKATFDLRFTPIEEFNLGILYTYESMSYTRSDNTESADPFYTLDLRAEYRLNGFTIFTIWENLTDEEYIYGDGYPAPPQSWLVGINRRF
jgi:iron complex outermembrane receptor protein